MLIDSLVSPSLPVIESRSEIHGITEAQLKDVRYTTRHAQAFLLSICSDRTILIGHSVHHDLRSLRFVHRYFLYSLLSRIYFN